ncbi:DNA polymerase III subunit alpha [Carnobacterium divergens]|uniref:DNA polymerase III subunit alpha n=1 Tax=Carnobacterium divergens TaxID=2748 RepID=UPI0010718244|nr:DNA polymerase III subunit alpha [Carnobacterium divergens]TFJ43024.1 DNA polymerase III subunit alpha [Carnobacterium divergens]TFJ50177.1 DNA polymerase III subunit alpha [Carnobacterium divergens]
MSFVQLQVISAYSLLKSTTSIEQLVICAKKNGYQAIALTDYNVLYGVVDFYKACLKHEIKPIIGLTLEVTGATHPETTYPIVLLAKNYQGYQNLMALSTKKMLLAGHEVVEYQLLKDYSEDLIAITPGETGEIEQALLNHHLEDAQQMVSNWLTIFAKDQFYLGVQLHQTLRDINEELQGLAHQHQIKTVAMHDVRYLSPNDDFSTKVLRAVDEGIKLDLSITSTSGPYYLPTVETIEAKFSEAGLTEAAQETEKIANTIQVEIPLHQHLLPKFPLKEGQETAGFLRERCFEGLKKRVPAADERYQKQLEHELTIIHKMGFEDYFLIVWDLMAYAHRSKIITGAGRGSAAGSLVSYVLEITDVDPIEFDLLFERFLNEERYTMPDIDLDFPDNRREEMLQYVKNKYGQDHVAQIATFGTLAAKMALRDVARVFGLNQNEANVWSKAIPKVLGITLESAYKQSKALQQLVAENDKNKLLFDTAKRIEGLPRHVSTHAAGVVISDQPLVSLIPLQLGSGEIHLTQYAMGNVEEIGLLKMDFLGLRNLQILDNAIQLIKQEQGVVIDLHQIPMNDEETLTIFRKADTSGVFQFESTGIKNVLRKLGPTSLEDIAAVNALYRPGPMEQIDLFIDRKKGKVAIAYPDDSLKDILGVTYGVMVYQEQVMQVASKMGGFTLGQADILRRAMSKKEKSVIDRERGHFIEGALAKGYSEETAATVYQYIERFANYGFNRSHAVGYAFIAYQLAYLKAHYPHAFFAALLNSAMNNPTKIKEYLLEAKKRKIAVFAPDINKSFYVFSLKNGAIQFGLGSIKGVRRDMILEVIRLRKEYGPYRDLIDFLRKIDPKWLKFELIEPFIYAGAFDSFEYPRGVLIASLEGIIDNIKISGNNETLIKSLEPKYEVAPDLTLDTRLEKEEEFLGAYLSGHPVERFENVRFFKQAGYIKDLQSNQPAKIIGAVKSSRLIRTKKGEQMAFVVVNDQSGECSITLFPKTYRQYAKYLEKNNVLYIEGKAEEGLQEEKQLIVNKIEDASDLSKKSSFDKLFIRVQTDKEETETLTEMHHILKAEAGNVPVILFYVESNKKIVLNDTEWVTISEGLLSRLEELLGKQNIVWQKGT